MSLPLYVKKLLTLCLFILLVPNYSCNLFSPKVQPPIPEIIKIEGILPNGDLDLKNAAGGDATTFKVGKGKTINWRLNTNSIDDITNIARKQGSADVLSVQPKRVGSSSNWTATVDPNAASNAMEDYYIQWKDKNGPHTYDPKIQVK